MVQIPNKCLIYVLMKCLLKLMSSICVNCITHVSYMLGLQKSWSNLEINYLINLYFDFCLFILFTETLKDLDY